MSIRTAAGPVTVMFTDMERSTDIAASFGNEAAQAVMRAHNEIVREQVAAAGGTELRSLGDGFKIAFTSVRKAVEAAIGIQRAVERHCAEERGTSFALRIGMNTGEAMEEEGDLFGTVVNAAARIAAKAKGGQILVSDVVKQLAAGSVADDTFVDRGRFRLKGFPDRWRLHEVVWREAAPAMPSIAETTPFVSRAEEKAELSAAIDQAESGSGSLIMISGEPGVGKTRLVQEAAGYAGERGFLCLTGRCYEMEGAAAYLPFIELLEQAHDKISPERFREALGSDAGEVARIMPEIRRWFPDSPPPMEVPDAQQERRFVFNSVRDFIARASRMRPLFIDLEDLHWADESSLLLLLHVAATVETTSIVIVGTYRDVGLEVTRPMAKTLEELLRRRLARRLTLRRLPTAGVEAMLGSISGMAPPPSLSKLIYEETDGNPFFVEEVFRHLVEEGRVFDERGGWRDDLSIGEVDVPESVRLVIGRRLERIGEDGKRSLTAAAVIGRDFDLQLLQEIAGIDEEELFDIIDFAERADLIRQTTESELRFAFSHELIRHTLLSSVSLPHRQKLHLRVADAMERLYPDDASVHAADLAHHLYQAGAAADPARTVAHLKAAASKAMEAAGYEDALRLYRTALSVIGVEDERSRADLLYLVGLAQRSLGDAEAALEAWREAIELYERNGENQTAAHICRETSFQLLWTGRALEGSEMAMRGLASLGDIENEDRAYLLALNGVVRAMGGFFEGSEELTDEAMRLAQQMGDPKLEGIACSARCLNYFFHQMPQRSLDAGLEALRLLSDSEWDRAQIHGFVQWALMFLGRIDEAVQMAEEIEPVASKLGHIGALLLSGRVKGIASFMTKPDVKELESFAHRDLDTGTGRIGWVADPYTWMGLSHFYRGDWSRAEAMFAKAASLEPPGAEAGRNRAMLFLHTCLKGDGAKALSDFEEMKTTLPDGVSVPTRGRWMKLYTAVEGLAHLGEHDRVAELYPAVTDAIATGTVGRIFDFRLLQTLAGIAASSAGMFDQAEEHFQEARRTAEALPHLLESIEIRRFAAAMLIRRDAIGDRVAAAELLTDAIDGYSSLGMPRHVDMARDLVRMT